MFDIRRDVFYHKTSLMSYNFIVAVCFAEIKRKRYPTSSSIETAHMRQHQTAFVVNQLPDMMTSVLLQNEVLLFLKLVSSHILLPKQCDAWISFLLIHRQQVLQVEYLKVFEMNECTQCHTHNSDKLNVGLLPH
jgi:hypothetical protein